MKISLRPERAPSASCRFFDVLTSRPVAKLFERLADRLQADDPRFGKRRSEPECGLPDVRTDVDNDRGIPHRSSDVRNIQDAVDGNARETSRRPPDSLQIQFCAVFLSWYYL